MITEAAELRHQPVSPDLRIRTVVGVWVVPITSQGQIFVVENRIAKFESQKVPGQLNCPAETYKPFDGGNFRLGTIPRAIEEEIGIIHHDLSLVKALGLIHLPIVGQRVVAAPYLIPVSNQEDLFYQPKDPTESTSPNWISLEEVDDRTIQIGPFEVPLFRTPMKEITRMIKDRQFGRGFHAVHSKAPLLEPALFDYLQSNGRPNDLPQ